MLRLSPSTHIPSPLFGFLFFSDCLGGGRLALSGFRVLTSDFSYEALGTADGKKGMAALRPCPHRRGRRPRFQRQRHWSCGFRGEASKRAVSPRAPRSVWVQCRLTARRRPVCQLRFLFSDAWPSLSRQASKKSRRRLRPCPPPCIRSRREL